LAPGDRESSARRYGIAEVLKVQRHLAARAGAPGGGDEWRLAAGRNPSSDGAEMILQARGAWWYVSPARR